MQTKGQTTNSQAEFIQKQLEALQCADCSVRIAAIHALMEHRAQIDKDVHLYLQVELVRMALLEDDRELRVVALRAIGSVWGGFRSISTLKISLQHPHEDVRAAAAQAVADIGTRVDLGDRLNEALSTLLLAFSDKHWAVRVAAIQAMRRLGLHNIGKQEFINAIMLAMDDKSADVRQAAVQALSDLKGTRALPRLALIAKRDSEAPVRDTAQDVLQDVSMH